MKCLKLLLPLLLLFCLLGAVNTASAQCAQCAAQVETSSANGSNAARGLNMGIMFLLAAPYLAVAIGGYIWYRSYRKKNVKLRMPSQPLNLN